VFLLTCVRELEMDVESTLKHMHISCYRKRDTNEGKRGCVCVCGFFGWFKRWQRGWLKDDRGREGGGQGVDHAGQKLKLM